MSWEKRQRGGLYYYRFRRINGRRVKQYFGCGAAAEQAAREDQERRALQASKRQAAIDEQRRYQEMAAPVVRLDQEIDALMRATLTAAGYYQHDGGQWRKRHGQVAET